MAAVERLPRHLAGPRDVKIAQSRESLLAEAGRVDRGARKCDDGESGVAVS